LGEEGAGVVESSLTKVSELEESEEAVDGGFEIRDSGSTNLIVEVFSGRAGNLVWILSSSTKAVVDRVGVGGLE
jgi:hypothetical protein